jgi:hypothetical protein
MKLLVFSDIHGDANALERLMDIEADHYIAAGDLCTFSRGLDAMCSILQRHGDKVWLLPGNHESESQIETACRVYGLNPLHGRSFEVNGCHVAGLGYSNPTPFNTPGEYSEAELGVRLEAFSELRPLVLICHCPPLHTPLDEAAPGRHLGSSSVAEFIERVQPRYFVSGHIHESAGRRATLGSTEAFSAGKTGVVLEL